MPSKIRDKDRDRDLDTPKSRDKQRHRSSRPSRKSSSKDPDKASRTPERRSSHASLSVKRTASMPIPELDQRDTSNSPHGSRSTLPYPSFSKAHSKEAVGSREDVVNKRMSYYTPDPTDLDRTQTESDEANKPNTTGAPPSPPLTTMEQMVDDRKTSTTSVDKEDQRRASASIAKEDRSKSSSNGARVVKPVREERKRTDLQKNADELKRRLQGKPSLTSERKSDSRSPLSRSRNSQREKKEESKSSYPAEKLKPDTPSKLKPPPVSVEDASSSTASAKAPSLVCSSTTDPETATESIIDSDATSIAPNQPQFRQQSIPPRENYSSPTTDPDSPRTPTLSEPDFPFSRKESPASVMHGEHGISGPFDIPPGPPPPPPPPTMPYQMPRVDYLMQNGGLNQSVPKTLLGAGQPSQTSQGQPISAQVDRFFAPFHTLLDDYTKVVARSGSLAVATGYRSVARRLLDRLEVIFARDISSETCDCIVCQSSPLTNNVETEQGVSWGEILEYVGGRQELPPWPPFVLDSTQGGLGISSTENQMPMQNLDIDVPDEFRDHYVRQSKKTKQSVDKWLASQPESPTTPPQDVDDETLTFAMLTRLEPDRRPLFSSLLGIAPSKPPSRAATPLMAPTSSLLERTGLAIQRLYRLLSPPRDPESAIYLLTNPALHNVLATLSTVNDGEWEMLTSGRFDGFLRSGAEDHSNPHPLPSQAASRGPTPAIRMTPSIPFSRGPTPLSRNQTPAPASVGAPVSQDEETEIAVLAEVEREIFFGMEALEDAFEALHCKAETVRRTLRERGAGLSMASQARRGSGNLDARMGTPANGMGGGVYAWESETDDGIEDGMSELAPDDSASNISRSRVRRPKRRTERRTPAPVEEEDEGSEGD